MATTLAQMNAALAAVDFTGKMAGITYSLTLCNTLAPDWYVFIPYGNWANSSASPPNPSPLEGAILTLLHRTDGGPFFLDLTYLGQDATLQADFFVDPNATETIVNRLATLISANSDNPTIVIRYLVGLPNVYEPNLTNFLTALFKKFPSNSNATLYFGNFSPTLNLPSLAAIEGLGGIVQTMWKWVLGEVKVISQEVSNILARIESSQLIEWLKGFLGAQADTLGNWNHSKIVALSGFGLVQGGANYWPEYMTTKTSPFDTSMTITGAAEYSAHRFVDSMWDYLNQLSPTDPRYPQATILNGAANSTPQAAPLYNQGMSPSGTMAALAVAKNGFGSAEGLVFPALILDAVRDFFLNIVAEVTRAHNGPPETMPQVLTLLDDENPYIQNFLRALGVSPASWASRRARNLAVASAQSAVYLSQQKLMMDDLMDGDSSKYVTLIGKINSALDCHWDGFVRPWDFYVALATALASTSRQSGNHPSIQIVCSSNGAGGYEDPMTAQQFTRFTGDLATLMTGLQTLGKISFSGSATAIVSEFLGYKQTTPPSNPDLANHSKVIVVDGTIMYVGSHNIYPSYNTEFGIWIDDMDSITNYLSQYWNSNPGLWSFASTISPS